MEALLSSLIKLDVPNTHCVDASGRLTRLAFTSTKAVQLTTYSSLWNGPDHGLHLQNEQVQDAPTSHC
jgi:hypothetical protein